MRPLDEDITAWALAAGKGDRRALEKFVRATQRDVWQFTAHLAAVDLADDLTQETYLRALPSLPRFAARATARTWLLSIARRVVVDNVRTAMSRPRRASTDDWVSTVEQRQARTHDSTSGFEDVVEVQVLLDALAPERREALVLTQLLGFSYAEAAAICDCPIGTVRSRVARARDDLQQGTPARRTGSG
ncbi:sigma-70 family RNA polymerase sigma factor [Actinokineospora bangkokensis]|uniref:RNA polymerase sigma factor n=1 Tax=Actinokineospora bangkokensis TaxID=1193682 RepID=A0A1Q9LIV1_9PSEU|nr:sigma-70 family RNA polymerase sigma factor [Actinokineospora bangkokensis]OLR91982.1 RNA polymerase subunit sigma [Actinokineospora bangkokensis]